MYTHSKCWHVLLVAVEALWHFTAAHQKSLITKKLERYQQASSAALDVITVYSSSIL
jgi:hypothetical protein